jgi:hypothetical protein
MEPRAARADDNRFVTAVKRALTEAPGARKTPEITRQPAGRSWDPRHAASGRSSAAIAAVYSLTEVLRRSAHSSLSSIRRTI